MSITINKISLSASVIARTLATVAFLLVLASVAGQVSKFVFGHGHLKGFVVLFDVNYEGNIPTSYSVLLLLFAALLLSVIAVLHRKQRGPHASKWAILSLGFLLMAFDEAFSFHEMLISPLRTLLGDGSLGIFYFAWVIPGIILVLVLGLFFLRFLLHLPSVVMFRFLMAAVLYLGGAIGVELFEGRHVELHGAHNLMFSMFTTVEESLEMAGVIVFIWALLKYSATEFRDMQFQFED